MRKTLYFMTLFALVAVAAMSVFFNATGTVSAQSEMTAVRGEQVSTETLYNVLNFKSGADIAVFANNGIADNGNSSINGNLAIMRGDVKGLNRASVQGRMLRREEGFDVNQAGTDLAQSFANVSHTPCTQVSGMNLSGKTFAPGVYCLAAAELAGEMVLDANNDENGIFVFRVGGSLNTAKGSSITLRDGARAYNVFFFAGDSVTVADGTDFNGSILAQNNITVNDAKVTGRAISLNGTVALNGAEVVQQTGLLEICKTTVGLANGTNPLAGRTFTFTVAASATAAGATITVRDGFCSIPVAVPSGPITVTETAGTGTGTFVISNATSGTVSPNAVTGTNVALNQIFVTVGTGVNTGGTVNAGETQINVTNRAAVTSTLEICKVVPDSDIDANIAGTAFSFQIFVDTPQARTRENPNGAVLNANGTPATFTVRLPVGGGIACTLPISVLLPPNANGTLIATINELFTPGFTFSGAVAQTGNGGGGIIGTPLAVGGTTTGSTIGTFQVQLNAGATQTNQTIVTVTNRSIPGQIKVCKATPNTALVGTIFNFVVTGQRVDPIGGAAIGTATDQQLLQIPAGTLAAPVCAFVPGRFQSGSTVTINEVLTLAQRIAGVRLGRVITAVGSSTATSVFATNGTNGGTTGLNISGAVFAIGQQQVFNAAFTAAFNTAIAVPGTTQVQAANIAFAAANTAVTTAFGPTSVNAQGTFMTAFTTGFNTAFTATLAAGGTQAAAVAAGLAAGNTAGVNALIALGVNSGVVVQVANVGGATGAATGGINVTARNQVIAVEFDNFIFNGVALKICKLAGAGVTAGQTFSFTVTPDNLGILNQQPFNVNVIAGQCTEVNGPFSPNVLTTGGTGGVGSFNNGSSITIQETAASATGTVILAGGITSNIGFTAGTTPNLITRTANITFTGIDNGQVAEVIFTNSASAPARVESTRFDFDGDRKADVSVFRPSNGAWYLQNSSTDFRGVQFGQAGDKLVAADYDNDGKSDIAVYRPSNSTWYLNRSTAGFAAVQFGAAGDIATPADFDGDGKAELAVYRPSSGMWITLSLATNAVNYVPFGGGNDIPVAADYDGDGKADYAVYRPSNGVWYMLQSTKGFGAIQFGNATDKPVVADYDGDGRADQAVYRSDKATGTSTWYVMGSKVGLLVNQFGLDTDSPVPADYDGDGKTDFGVYRASTGYWYATKSGSPFSSSGSALMSIKFGDATDTPVPMP